MATTMVGCLKTRLFMKRKSTTYSMVSQMLSSSAATVSCRRLCHVNPYGHVGCHTGVGREYVRTQRLYGDGRTEVVTREMGEGSRRGGGSGDGEKGRRHSARSRTSEAHSPERRDQWHDGGRERVEGRRQNKVPPNHLQQFGKRHFGAWNSV